jgi:carbamoylphosphate synthase small subunit
MDELSCEVGPPCSLVLADGSVFVGRSFGAQVPADGEVGELINENIFGYAFT